MQNQFIIQTIIKMTFRIQIGLVFDDAMAFCVY